MQPDELEYVGFWPRAWAAIIDTCLILVITVPILIKVYGASYLTDSSWIAGPTDFLVSWVFPAFVSILFWHTKQATPGKMVIMAKIVDERTGGAPTVGQLIGRYFSYFLASLPLCAGIIWVAFDRRKQGWHDKLAGTVVVRKKNGDRAPVSFNG